MGTDSLTPAAPAGPVATAGTGGRSPRARRRRAVLIVLAAVLVLALLTVAAVWGYGRSLDNKVNRTDVFGGMGAARPDRKVAGAMNILVVGSDSRNPDTTGSRSDTLLLAHVDAAHRHAYVVSIPRDTWVHVPAAPAGRGGDTMAKINSAYAWGGMPLVVQTVEEFTGVHIDHTAAIDFAGFQQVVDAVGGITMNVDQTVRSIHPPYRLFTAGTHDFDGAQALDYVRQREQFADGDFARERHQQEFLKALMDKATRSGTLANPVKLNGFLQSVTKSMTVDQNFDLPATALALRSLRSGDVTFLASPSAGTGNIGDQSVVRADSQRAAALYRAMADDALAQWLSGPGADPSASAGTGSRPGG